MSQSTADVEDVGDAELIAAVRGGDLTAYGTLFARHVAAARRLARQLTNATDADDLVSDAFDKVLSVLQRGGGPDIAFRAYLLTSVRRLHVDRIRSTSRLQTTDDMEPYAPGVPFHDTAVEGFDNQAAAAAFASLPERWQMVLWHTEVEGQKPAEVAALLGMSANSVSALAYRAREGLRQAFLNSHAPMAEEETCRWTHDHLGGYVREGLSRRDTAKVEKHLDGCRRCTAIYLELTEVNSHLGALLAPILLGAAGAAYLAGASSAAAKGGLLLMLFDRSKELVAANTQAVAVAGVAAVTVAAGVTYTVIANDDPGRPAAPAVAEAAPPVTSSQAPGPATTSPPSRRPRPDPSTSPGVAPTAAPTTALPPAPTTPPPPGPSSEPTPPPTTAPTDEPTSPPTAAPTDEPTDKPTSEPTDEPTDEPTPEPHDLVLEVSQSLLQVTFSASGLPSGGSAVLRLSWSGFPLGFVPSRCTPSGQTATCILDEDNPSVDAFLVNLVTGTIDAVLEPVGFEDPDHDNNSWSWSAISADPIS